MYIMSTSSVTFPCHSSNPQEGLTWPMTFALSLSELMSSWSCLSTRELDRFLLLVFRISSSLHFLISDLSCCTCSWLHSSFLLLLALIGLICWSCSCSQGHTIFSPISFSHTDVRKWLREWILLLEDTLLLEDIIFHFFKYFLYFYLSAFYRNKIAWCSYSTWSRAKVNCSLLGWSLFKASVQPSYHPYIA